MAAAPRSTAARSLNPPPNLPIGVRAPATITDALMTILLPGLVMPVYADADGPTLPRGGRGGAREDDPRRHRAAVAGAVRGDQPGAVLGCDRSPLRPARQPVLEGAARRGVHRSHPST